MIIVLLRGNEDTDVCSRHSLNPYVPEAVAVTALLHLLPPPPPHPQPNPYFLTVLLVTSRVEQITSFYCTNMKI